MPATFDPVGDFLLVADGLQSVTLTDRDDADQAIEHALRRAVTRRESEASNGFYSTSDVHWHLPQSEVTGEPQLGWVVTDADENEWTALAVEDQTLTDRWRLTCRNLVIAERLDTLITIQVSTTAKGEGGAHERTWADQQRGIRARFQRAFTRGNTQSVATVGQHVGTNQIDPRSTVFWRESIVLTARHRIVKESTGQRFRIVGYRDPERIDKLAEVDVVPWTDDYLEGEIQ